MIIVDGKQLNLRDGNTKAEKWVIARMKAIKDKKDLVVIKDPKPYKYDDRGRKLKKEANGFKLTTRRINDNGAYENWAYCTKSKTNPNTGNKEFVPAHYIMVGEDYLNPGKDSERIFFLTEIMNVSDYGLIVEDKEKDAQVQLSKEVEEGDVAMYIKSNRSPLTVDQLRLLALSWGMGNANELPESILRIDFFKRVSESKGKRGRGYKGFLQDVDNLLSDKDNEVKMRAIVELALKSKVIAWDETRLKMLWGGTDRIICAIPPNKITEKREFLNQHFSTHKNDREILYASVEGAVDDMPVFGFEDLKRIGNLPKLKSKIKEMYPGIEIPPKATKEETLSLVEEEIKNV